MNLREYAETELSRIKKDEDGWQDEINKDILQIIDVFREQEHSGASANYAINILERLLRFKPIQPLTGDDGEWDKEPCLGTIQNKRCFSVFKDEDGSVKDIDAFVISSDGGLSWYFSNSIKPKNITFPYMPPTRPERIYIEFTNEDEDEYEIITDMPERINALREKKQKEWDKEKKQYER